MTLAFIAIKHQKQGLIFPLPFYNLTEETIAVYAFGWGWVSLISLGLWRHEVYDESTNREI